MKPVLWIPALCAITLALSGCGNLGGSGGGLGKGTQQAGVGPFDENGNYVEAWADNPSKWRKSGKSPSPHELRTDEIPVIAKNDQPPQNSIPLESANSGKRKSSVVKSAVASRTRSSATSAAKTTRSSSSSSTKSSAAATRSKSSAKSAPSTSKTSSSSARAKSKSTTTTTATRPKTPSPTAAKPKPTKRVVKKVE